MSELGPLKPGGTPSLLALSTGNITTFQHHLKTHLCCPRLSSLASHSTVGDLKIINLCEII